MKASHFLSLSVAAVIGGIVAAPVSAAIVDDFSSYSTGNFFPNANWSGPSRSLAGGESITVQNNANNLVGNHLQIAAKYPTIAVDIALPSSLSVDGDYVQYGVLVSTGNTYLGMQLRAAALGDPNSQPPGSIGMAHDGAPGGYNAFTVHHNGIYNYSNYPVVGQTPWITPPPTPGAGYWYILRATMRDAGGAPGIIDSYDFEVFDNLMNPIGSKLGVSFFGGEGPISHIALAVNEQTGTSNAVVLFDEITIGQIPEPASVGLLAGIGALAFGRRRAA